MLTEAMITKLSDEFDALEKEFQRGADIMTGFLDVLINNALDKILNDIMNSPDFQAELRANVRFGQRVNRSNRHKWRRCYLLEKQLGAPATDKDLPDA